MVLDGLGMSRASEAKVLKQSILVTCRVSSCPSRQIGENSECSKQHCLSSKMDLSQTDFSQIKATEPTYKRFRSMFTAETCLTSFEAL